MSKIQSFNAGSTDQIKLGKIRRFTVADKSLLVCNVDDQFYTVDDFCTHEDAPLSLGCLKGHDVECSLHGGRFNVITGEATVEPAEIALQTYPTQIIDGQIIIELGDNT